VKQRLPTAEERALWKQITTKTNATAVRHAKVSPKVLMPKDRTQTIVKQSLTSILDNFSALDKAFVKRLQNGLIPINGRLDLHGHTLESATPILHHFVQIHISKKSRCLLIITGKGRPMVDELNPLKRLTLLLLETFYQDSIVCACHAAAKHGGNGALYVYLRRV
jgi:DNA-nicking Smr family endonuclease